MDIGNEKEKIEVPVQPVVVEAKVQMEPAPEEDLMKIELDDVDILVLEAVLEDSRGFVKLTLPNNCYTNVAPGELTALKKLFKEKAACIRAIWDLRDQAEALDAGGAGGVC